MISFMKAVDDLPTAYVFGDVCVERHNFRVRKNGQPRTIEPRAFEVLIYLIEHRERVVEKEELFEQVWKQTFVTDSALAQEIKNIRHALVDDAAAPRYIETVRKHGYRFVAEVEEVAPARAGPSKQIEELVQPAAIAVLPFINMSGDPDNEYFCDGLSEELINRLTKLKGLRVVAQTSSFSFKGKETDVREIGQKLNAGFILEGSVRRAGDRLRVSLQLINAAGGYHAWSESYDYQWGDLFAIQDEISLAVVDKLKIKLFPDDRKALAKRYTENLQAYHLYLRGRYFWNKRVMPGGLQKAMEYFQQAIQVDPRYALAYTGLADAYTVLGVTSLAPAHQVFPLAKAMVEKAFELDDELAEAHASLALIRLAYDYDFAAAERECKRALELNPAYVQAYEYYHYDLLITGRIEEALTRINQALELDPISPMINATAGRALCYARQYEASVEQLQKTIELDPQLAVAHCYLGMTYTLQGRYEEALAALHKALEISGEFPWATYYVGLVHVFTGNRDKAREILRELKSPGNERPVLVSGIYSALGENDKVFEWLERGYEERDFLLPWINVLPDNDHLRSDPRFQELIRRLGLAK
jgi:TolB-like protein/Flp pilus assembly protein TadD